MLRGIRFATRLGFQIEQGTLEAIRENRERIRIISQERITEELNKILMCDHAERGIYAAGIHRIAGDHLSRALPDERSG